MRTVTRTEQLIRSLVLLAACATFSLIAYLAGLYNLPDERWTYAGLVAIVGCAAVVSRVGTRWIMRWRARSRAQAS